MADATGTVNPAAAADLVRAYHRGEVELGDAELDEALGFDAAACLDAEDGEAAGMTHPGESVVHVATPYSRCRAFFHAVSPGPEDLVLDLGCGSGRVVVYGALVTPARFRGIELVESRAEIARRAVRRLGLDRVEILHGNVLDRDLEAGTVFFLFRPFSTDTEARVLARLHAMARVRPVTVGAYRLQPGLFDPAVLASDDPTDLRVYRSR